MVTAKGAAQFDANDQADRLEAGQRMKLLDGTISAANELAFQLGGRQGENHNIQTGTADEIGRRNWSFQNNGQEVT
ncbi:MAG: hypothetical protein AAGA96_13270 [Verrucomicrobiota bacterium]